MAAGRSLSTQSAENHVRFHGSELNQVNLVNLARVGRAGLPCTTVFDIETLRAAPPFKSMFAHTPGFLEA